MTEAENGYSYWVNMLLAIDQLFNAITGGSCDETFSSRTYRMASLEKPLWMALEKVIDILFYWDTTKEGISHCESSYLVEMNRGHMPKAMMYA